MIAKLDSRLLGSAALVAAVLAMAAPVAAARPSTSEAPVVTSGRPPRLHRDVAWRRGALDAAGLSGWTAIYDHDTDVPLRLWGPGQPAPGAIASPAAAEAWARGFLAAHLAVLAPGASPDDFVVVANQLDPSGDVRSVGFAQRAGGVAVLGGTISFAFKRDRMILAGSTALPHVVTPGPVVRAARLTGARVAGAAAAWLGATGRSVVPRGGAAAGQVIVPIVHARGPAGVDITYTLAEQVTVEATTGEPGRWTVFVDAATGAAFARETALMFASGTVLFDVPDRAPRAAAGRHPQPAGDAVHHVDGIAETTGLDGLVTWTDPGDAVVLPGLTGPRVAVTNRAGALASDALALPDGGTAIWSRAGDPAADAQLDAFVYANQVKQFARTRLAPALAYLDQQLSVNVNESPGMCNAYSTGDDLHFFPQTAMVCENTGRMADVVYHEFGHSLHRNAIIPGVGQFNGSMSEGVADTLAVAITGDSGMGRGLFFNDDPLRELNPAIKKTWPRDADGEVHDEGEIYGETMWDLRSNLQARMGTAAGFAQFLQIYYGTVQRAVDIPSCFAEALVADDDDGDLANGTPHDCDIVAAFMAHGLFDPAVIGGLPPPVRDGFSITLGGVAMASAACQVPSVQSAAVAWRPRGGSLQVIPMQPGPGTLGAVIPTQPAGTVVEYQVAITLSNGVVQRYPDNPADPYYQFYVGDVTKIWCADFEAGAAGWAHRATSSGADRWQVGPPGGLGGDPAAAYSGENVLGTALTGDGRYAASMTTSVTSPTIDLHRHGNVHLQYQRWLGVEDGFYDQATIKANNDTVWRNFASPTDPRTAEINHIDQEWRFQDIDVSAQAAAGAITLAFGITSDSGLEAAGWNLDEVCLVAPAPRCGDGVVDAGEACDDGNTVSGDGCSATCQDEAGSGGCSAGGHPAAPVGLAALVLGLGLRRRRDRG